MNHTETRAAHRKWAGESLFLLCSFADPPKAGQACLELLLGEITITTMKHTINHTSQWTTPTPTTTTSQRREGVLAPRTNTTRTPPPPGHTTSSFREKNRAGKRSRTRKVWRLEAIPTSVLMGSSTRSTTGLALALALRSSTPQSTRCLPNLEPRWTTRCQWLLSETPHLQLLSRLLQLLLMPFMVHLLQWHLTPCMELLQRNCPATQRSCQAMWNFPEMSPPPKRLRQQRLG